MCEMLTCAEWAGRGVILHSKALPGITVTVSWMSGISSASSASQLCSYIHTHTYDLIRLGQTQTQLTAHTVRVQTDDSQKDNCHKFNTPFKQQCISLQDIMD